MIQSRQYNIMTYQTIIFYVDSTLVLKQTSSIDKNIFTDMYIFTEISIKRRKQSEALIDRPSDNLRE